MRYFREEIPGTYELVRLQLDAAWNLPNGRGTVSCIRPESMADRDNQGRILVCLKGFFCEWEPAASILPQFLASGAVVELTEDEWMASVPLSLPIE